MEGITGRLTGMRALWATATQSWFAPFAVLVALFNVLLAVWVIADKNGKMPGQAIGPVIILTLTAALLVGLRLRWRAGQLPIRVDQPVGGSTTGHRIGLGFVALVAVVAVILGAMSSIFLFGAGVLTLAGVVVAARRRSRSVQPRVSKSSRAEHIVLADVLIVIGALPALGMWWLIIPGVLALVVIGGVIGTGPGTRRRAAEAV